MEKLKMHTPDHTAQNIQKLAELFPGCVTEIRDEAEKVTQGIDLDQLRQELSGVLVEGPRERYHLDWPGKREAILAANAPIAKTLRPSRGESVNFDTTKNLFIEGDNLDALKLLQETYLGRVKLIYIDPPYNTGSDFIYEDDFAEDSDTYLLRSNQEDEGGKRLVANTEANGRFHSDWLSMLYPRLKLARNLLSEDGVIFISIDDHEQDNLRKLCDEVFGAQNFIANVIWQKKYSTKADSKDFSESHEYITCYRRGDLGIITGLERSEDQESLYKNPDNDPRGPWTSDNLLRTEERDYAIYPVTSPTGQEYWPPKGSSWRYNKAKMSELLTERRLWFGEDGNGRPRLKRFRTDVRDRIPAQTIWGFAQVGHTDEGTKELARLFDDTRSPFPSPKPVRLLQRVVEIASAGNDIVMDFFAGSGTLGHAVMAQNASDQAERRFVLVQIPKMLDPESKEDKAAAECCASLGKPLTIAELTKERIRRAGNKIMEDAGLNAANLDAGFRVVKIDTSNMLDVYYAPDHVAQADLLGQVDNIRPDRLPEDLLFQVLVDWGLDLALPIAEEMIEGKQVFFVDTNALAACFDTGVTDEMVKAIALRKPLRAVFRDSSYGTDSVKINVEQIFKLLSPETEVRSI
jgi:adenine-specific DNA-methyltransferase